MIIARSTQLLVATAFLLGSCSAGNKEVISPAPAPAGELTVTSTSGRVLTRDAALTFEVDNKEQRRELRGKVIESIAKQGGYVASEYEKSLVFRVPSNRLDAAVEELEPLGNVTEKNVRVEEVTAQHTDLIVRADNARKLRERLQNLLAQAKNVQEMLEIEKELGRVTEELERYEAQLRDMNSRVALARLDVNIEQAVRPGPIGWVFYGIYKGVKWLFVWDS